MVSNWVRRKSMEIGNGQLSGKETHKLDYTTKILHLWLRLFVSRRFLSSLGPGPGQVRVRKVRVRLAKLVRWT